MESVYPDDLFYLTRKIRRRKVEKRMIALAIARNPHLNPEDQKHLSDMFNREMSELEGIDPKPELDRAGIAALKERLASESRGIKVK